MKVFLLGFTFFTGILGCSSQAARAASLPEGCGVDTVQYKVRMEKPEEAPGAATAGKAQLIFLQTEDGEFSAAPISRFAVDGNWVGATKGVSYFSVEIEPGQHVICASRQSAAKQEKDNIGVVKLQAEAGQTYFYQFALKRTVVGSPEFRVSGQGVPGSSMAEKPRETSDTADLSAQPAASTPVLLHKVLKAVSTPK